jgi:hypothetical protein
MNTVLRPHEYQLAGGRHPFLANKKRYELKQGALEHPHDYQHERHGDN